jgi:hypothetical protein
MLLDLPQDVMGIVSDFVSPPFALKPQLGIPPLPLHATYVRLMMMSRMKNMFSFPARFLSQEVHCQIKLRSLQSMRLSTSTDGWPVLLIMVAPSDQERPPRWKNHPAEE